MTVAELSDDEPISRGELRHLSDTIVEWLGDTRNRVADLEDEVKVLKREKEELKVRMHGDWRIKHGRRYRDDCKCQGCWPGW